MKKTEVKFKIPYGDKDFYLWTKRPQAPTGTKWHQALIEKTRAFKLPVQRVSFFIALIDFSKRSFIYLSESAKSVTGYSASEFLAGGMKMATETIYEEDHERVTQMHQDILHWHFNKPIHQRTSFRYSQQFRISRKDGRVIWFETQDYFLELDDQGKPLIAFQMCQDITHLKKDLNMTLKIYKAYKNGEQRLVKKLIYPWKSNETLSNREVQILDLLSKGFSSKQIAGKLGISETTVSKHRQNMLRKTNLPNSAALVNQVGKT